MKAHNAETGSSPGETVNAALNMDVPEIDFPNGLLRPDPVWSENILLQAHQDVDGVEGGLASFWIGKDISLLPVKIRCLNFCHFDQARLIMYRRAALRAQALYDRESDIPDDEHPLNVYRVFDMRAFTALIMTSPHCIHLPDFVYEQDVVHTRDELYAATIRWRRLARVDASAHSCERSGSSVDLLSEVMGNLRDSLAIARGETVLSTQGIADVVASLPAIPKFSDVRASIRKQLTPTVEVTFDERLVSSVHGTLSCIQEAVTSGTKFMSAIPEKLRELTEYLTQNWVSVAIRAICINLLLWAVYMIFRSCVSIVSAIVQLILTPLKVLLQALSPKDVERIEQVVSSLEDVSSEPPGDDLHTQGVEDFAYSMGMLLVNLMSADWFKRLDLSTFNKAMLSWFSTNARCVEGAKNIFASIYEISRSFFHTVLVAAGCKGLISLKSDYEDVSKFMEMADEFLAQYTDPATTGFFNEKNASRSHSLGMQFRTLRAKFVNDAVVQRYLNTYLRPLADLSKTFCEKGFAPSKDRVPPIFILLHGKPGVGKSIAIDRIGRNLLHLIDPQTYPSTPESWIKMGRDIYNRCSENKFWDGYMMQLICNFDDLLQAIDCGNPGDSEAMNIIRIVNSMPAQLHMANMADKSNTFFVSKIVTATTNLDDINHATIKSIHEPDAFLRRVSCRAYLTLGPATNGEVIDENRWRFRTYVGDVRQLVGAHEPGVWGQPSHNWVDMTYVQFVAFCYDCYKKSETLANTLKKESFISRSTLDNAFSSVANQESTPICENADHHGLKTQGFVYDLGQSLYSAAMDAKDAYCTKGFVAAGASVAGTLTSEVMWPALKGAVVPVANLVASPPQDCGCDAVVDRSPVSILQWAAYHRRTGIPPGKWRRNAVMFDKFCHQSTCYYAYETGRIVAATCRDSFEEIEVPQWFATGGARFVSQASPYGFGVSHPKRALKSYLDYLRDNPLYAVTTAAFLAWSAYKLFMCAKAMVDLFTQSASNATRVRQRDVTRRMTPQSSGVSDMITRVRRNCATLELATPKYDRSLGEDDLYTLTYVGTAINLGNNVWVMPYHYIAQILLRLKVSPRGRTYVILSFLDGSDVEMETTTLLESLWHPTAGQVSNAGPDTDLPSDIVFFHYACANRRKSIVNMLSPASVAPIVSERVIVATGSTEVATTLSKAHTVSAHSTDSQRNKFSISGRALWYSAPTISGDCGFPVVSCSTWRNNRNLLGFHVAGNERTSIGVGVWFTLDDYNAFIQHLTGRGQDVEEDVELRAQAYEPPHDFYGASISEYIPDAPRTSGKTTITPTPLYGKWGPAKTAPAVLRPRVVEGVRVDPHYKALGPYMEPSDHEVITQDQKDFIVGDVLRMLTIDSDLHPVTGKRLLTFEEACAGIEGVDYVDSLNRASSAGYPWSLMSVGKRAFFGKEGAYQFDSPECIQLRQAVTRREEDARLGKTNDTIYTDFLKDERRSLLKVQTCSTRFISASPLDYSVLVRMYFMAFNQWIQRNRIHNGIAMGVNVYGHDWTILAEYLSKFGNSVVAGDFTKLDAHEYPELHDIVLDIIQAWYGDSNGVVRRTLWEHLKRSSHVYGGYIYDWSKGLPSGHPMTTTVNCLVVHILFRLIWTVSVPRAFWNTFQDHVALIAYGDDNVLNLSDFAQSIFSQSALPGAMLRFGFKYTDETKGSCQVSEFRSLREVTFLKRSFRTENGVWLAPLDLDVILEMSYWTAAKIKGEEVHDIFETALHELSMHPQSIWDVWYPKMSNAYFDTFGYYPQLHSFGVEGLVASRAAYLISVRERISY